MAELRADEAGALVRSGHERGAYYLGGIAIECALKACIAKKTRRHEFPPERKYIERVYSHELTELLNIAGLKDRLEKDMKKKPALARNWGVVQGWRVNCRYDPSVLKGTDMHMAITGPDGVLAWIKRRW